MFNKFLFGSLGLLLMCLSLILVLYSEQNFQQIIKNAEDLSELQSITDITM
jgi:hypothetical protein